jgi:5-enolpyruvylshikimate-3-phosphate synthase
VKDKSLVRRTLARIGLDAETRGMKRKYNYYKKEVDSVLESADMQNMLNAIREFGVTLFAKGASPRATR